MSDTIALGFKLTGEADMKRALTDIGNAIKLNVSDLSLLSAKYAENGKSVEALTAKNKVLQSSLENEQKNAETLKTAIEKATSAHAAAGTQIERLKDELSTAKDKMEEMRKSSDTTREDLLKQQTVIKDLNKELKDAEKAYSSTGKNVTSWGVQLNNSEAKVISLNKQLAENEKALKRVDVNTNTFSGKMADLGNKISDTDEKLGGGLTKSVEAFGLAAVAAGALAVKSFLEFSDQTAKVRTLLDESVLSYNDAKKAILDMSSATAQSANVMAGAMYDALSSGVETADVQKFMAQSSKLAVAGFTDVGTTVDLLTTILNSYGIKSSEVSSISDKLLLTQDKGKVTVGELSNGLGNLTGISANAGVKLNEVLAATAALTAGGLPASSSITSLKSAISNIISPTAEAETAAKKLHLAFNAQALESKGLSGVLKDVKNATGGSAEKMAQLFGSTEALNAVMSLTGENNKLFTDTLKGMNSTAGKTDEVFNKVSSESGFKFNQSLETMKNKAIEVGDKLTPLIDGLSGLITIIGSIPAPVLMAVSGIILAITATLKIIEAINKLSGMGGTLGAFFGGFNVSSLKTAAIILGVVAALIALAAIIAVIIGKSNDLNSTMESIGKNVSQVKETASSANGGAIGHHARGTNNFKGGYTWVGEEGPEIVELPAGSKIYPTQKSLSMLPAYALGTTNHPGGPAIINDGNGYPGEIVDLPGGSRVYPHGTNPGATTNNYYITIDAHNVDDFNRVVKLAKQKDQMMVQMP